MGSAKAAVLPVPAFLPDRDLVIRRDALDENLASDEGDLLAGRVVEACQRGGRLLLPGGHDLLSFLEDDGLPGPDVLDIRSGHMLGALPGYDELERLVQDHDAAGIDLGVVGRVYLGCAILAPQVGIQRAVVRVADRAGLVFDRDVLGRGPQVRSGGLGFRVAAVPPSSGPGAAQPDR